MAHLTFDECRLPEPTMPDTPHPSPDNSSPEAASGAPLPPSIPGVVILGGAHGTLALARSLGRRGVPVWLVSNDTPLPTALAQFNRYSTSKIVIGDAAAGQLRVSGVFRDDDSHAFIDALRSSYGISISQGNAGDLTLLSGKAVKQRASQE